MKKSFYYLLMFLAFTQNFKTFTAEAATQKKAKGKESTLFGASELALAIAEKQEDKAVKLIESMSDKKLNQVSVLFYMSGNSDGDLLSSNTVTTSYLSMSVVKNLPSVFRALLNKKVDPNLFDASFAYTTLEILVDGLKNKPVDQDEKIKLLRLLLENTDPKKLNINREGKNGYTPLHTIVTNDASSLSDKQKNNLLQAIELLLKHGAKTDIPNNKSATPIMSAARDFPEAAQLLLRKDWKLWQSEDNIKSTILFYAFHAENPDIKWIKHLSKQLKHVTIDSGELPLNFLLNRYHLPKFGKLLQNHLLELIECLYVPNQPYFLPSGKYLENTSLLILAIEKVAPQLIEDCIQYLLKKSEIQSDINYLQKHGTALHSAVRRDSTSIIQLLLDYGADPELTTEKMPLTPLMLAIKEKKAAATSTLLNHYLKKENPRSLLSRITDQEGNSLLHIAASHYDPEIYDLILELYQKHAPESMETENKENKTAYNLLPRAVIVAQENARELIQEEKKEISQAEKRAQIAANVKRAKEEAAAEEKFQKFLEEKVQEASEISLTKVDEEDEQEAAAAADFSPPKKRFILTKALKTFAALAANPENTAMRDYFLEKQGYFDDPLKRIPHEKRARARFYQSLKAKGLDDETANQIVVQTHAFPLRVIKTVLLSSLVDDPSRTEKTGVRAYYTDERGTHHGTYELYWRNMPDGTQQIYHSLFKETGFTPGPIKSKKAATSADAAPTDATPAEFNLVGTFETTRTDLADGKTEHTFKDQTNGRTYTIIL